MSAPDIDVTRDGALCVVQLEGISDAGVEFVESYTIEQMAVVDAGRIIIPLDALPAFLAEAHRVGVLAETWA